VLLVFGLHQHAHHLPVARKLKQGQALGVILWVASMKT